MKKLDEKAFQLFHESWFDRIYRYQLALCHGDSSLAADCAQDTLIRIVKHIKVFKSEEIFWCWIASLSKSAFIDAVRKIQKEKKISIELAESICEQSNEHNELLHLLEKEMGALSPKDRNLLEGKYYDRHKIRDLAKQTGSSEKAVESRLARLRKKLKRLLSSGISET